MSLQLKAYTFLYFQYKDLCLYKTMNPSKKKCMNSNIIILKFAQYNNDL